MGINLIYPFFDIDKNMVILFWLYLSLIHHFYVIFILISKRIMLTHLKSKNCILIT